MKVLSCCFVAYSLFSKTANAFAPAPSRAHFAHGHDRHFHLRSTASSDSGIDQRKQVAIDALEKLLERQKDEVEDTEALLKQLQSFSLEGDGEMTKRAASVLSGVDYGFISRSEGAAFEKLHGGLANVTVEDGSLFEKYGPPANIVELGFQQFIRNLKALKGMNDMSMIINRSTLYSNKLSIFLSIQANTRMKMM